MRLGSLDVTPIYDGHGVIKATEFFVNTTAEDWAHYRQYVDGELSWDFPVGGYLVRSPDRLVLIDVGLGPHVRGFMSGGAFIQELSAAGVDPIDITDIVLSHLHADHFGWVSVGGRAVFENAAIHCSGLEWEYFVHGDGCPVLDRPVDPLPGETGDGTSWLDKLHVVADRMAFWSGEQEVLPGIQVTDGAGHTPGSSLVVLSSEGASAVLVGDALHCPAQLNEPSWQPIGDVDPAAAIDVRRSLAERFANTPHLVGGPHFPALGLGHVVHNGDGYEWKQVNS